MCPKRNVVLRTLLRGGNARGQRNVDSSLPATPIVFYVNPAGERGGGEVVLLNLLRHFPQNWRKEVVLLSCGSLAAELRALGVRTHVIPAGRFRQPWHLIRAIWHIARLSHQGKATLIDSAGAKGHIYGGLAAIIAGVPAVWRIQDISSSSNSWLRLSAMVPAAGLVAASRVTLDAYKRLHRLPKMVEIVYPGVDIDTLLPTPSKISLREELRIPSDRLLITVVGRLQEGKGQHIFLEAAVTVLEQRYDVHFLIVGAALFGIETEYPTQLYKLVEGKRLSEHISFTGQRHDVGRIMAAIDVLVQPSLVQEAFGYAAVEGMFLGKAVIASAAGGPLEIISDGIDGVLVPPGDVSALSHAILALLDDPARRERLGQAAMLTVRDRFTADRMAAEFIHFYERVLSNGGYRSPKGT